MEASQNPTIRRAYLIRPRQALLDKLVAASDNELFSICAEPNVVMTKPIPFEGKLESYRSLILDKCKEAFIAEIIQFEPFSDANQRYALLGTPSLSVASFDEWWVAEEIETIEIETTW